MPIKPGTLELLLSEIGPILSSLEQRLAPPDILVFLAELGFQLPPELLDDAAVADALTDVISHAAAIPQQLDDLSVALVGEDVAAVIQRAESLVERFASLMAALDTLASRVEAAASALGMASSELTELARDLPRRSIELVVIDHLESAPGVANTLQLLGIIERIPGPDVPGDPTRPELEIKRLHLSNLIDLIRFPTAYLETLYGWGSATFDGERLLAQLEDFFGRSGLPALLVPATGTDPPKLRVTLFELQPDRSLSPPGLAFTLEAPIQADFSTTIPLVHEAWTLQVITAGQFVAGLAGSIRPPSELTLLPPEGTLDGQLLLKIVGQLPELGARMVLLGIVGSSRLEVGRVEASLGMRFAWNGARAIGEAVADLRLEDGRVVLDTSEGDGFLNEVLGGLDGEAAFDLGVFWSVESGLRFEGSSALEIAIPVHVEVGPVELTGLVIRSLPAEGAIAADVSGNFRGELGPLKFVVEQLGFEVTASTREERGNLGPLNLGAAFKPPAGVGLSVDGGGFKGGGFLRFEPELEQYSGMLELEFQDQLTVKSIGLLSTRLPNGQSGFSLLLVISSEFTPIQLGFGFKLNGVGGLLGLNRTVRIDRLASGLRDNTLNSILFPTDVIANADRILSDLRQVFPPERGRFVFGPMAKITWGTPALLTADLGLIIEVPEPVRVAILGVVRAVVPSEQAAILRLQVNFLGVIDFEREHFSFDASLFDSKLLAFTLTGDMAVRLYWGADANFLLTVGGFHPAYQPPPMNLPALRRLTLALLDGDNPRLTLETYVAVTSNTVQLGARLELYAAAWKFNAYGFLSFDVLFQLNPFYFVAEVTAMLALRVGTSSIAALKLTLTLEGPTPWKAKGDARLRLCWFLTVKIRFNKTFGEARNTTLPDLAVLPLLVEALSARDNWEAELPSQRHRLESVRELPAAPDQLVVHPVGTLKISQKVVPLNIQIDRLGSQRPADARMFGIGEVQVGPDPTNSPAAQESFAPAQLFDMSDQEKLASPSFKSFDSGIRVGDPDRLHAAYAAAREVKYELKYIDSQRDRRPAAGASRRPLHRRSRIVQHVDAARRDGKIRAVLRPPAEIRSGARRGQRRPGVLRDREHRRPETVRHRERLGERAGGPETAGRADRVQSRAQRSPSSGAGL
jgi:hypothetical protein